MRRLINWLEGKAVVWGSPFLNYLVCKLSRFENWFDQWKFDLEQRFYGIESDEALLKKMRERSKILAPNGWGVRLTSPSKKEESVRRESIKDFVEEAANKTPRPASPKKTAARKKSKKKTRR